MSLTGELVLADGVELVAIGDLPETVRAAIPHDPGDYAVSRVGSRETSRVIDHDGWALLQHFQTPARIVDAVMRFAADEEADPDATLEGAYPMLSRLYQAGMLVQPEERAREAAVQRIAPGEEKFGVIFGALVHALEDTQVYAGRDPSGRLVAVKVSTLGEDPAAREALAMRRVPGVAPEVLGVHAWDGRGILVSEWVRGEDAARVAAGLRGQRGERSEAGLTQLAERIASAFAEVHEAGVLHGDVHPGNVLVEDSGRVRLIDFGLAWVHGNAQGTMGRGGVALYLDPEEAEARRQGRLVALSERAEQFAVGALLYFVWTGAPYVDFSLEQDRMYDQIVREPPLSFAQRRVPPFPGLEAVLGRALAKAPEDRFPSCRDLALAFESLVPEAVLRDAAAVSTIGRAQHALRQRGLELFERCGLRGAALRDGPSAAPYASVNFGAAGIAYAMYRLARAKDDAVLLATAEAWVHKAKKLSAGDEAFFSADMHITEASVGRGSLFHSANGIHAVGALVALATGDAWGAREATAAFVAAAGAPPEEDDLTLGTAGLLLACAELLEASEEAPAFDRPALAACGDRLARRLEERLFEQDVASSQRVTYLGVAHGWSGILLALLRWRQATSASAESLRDKLGELSELAEPHGKGVRWPISNRTARYPAYMDGWCNGTAGHAILWAVAHEVLRDGSYAELTERAAWSAGSSETPIGTLCCGLGGIGYALAAAHRVTGDSAWLLRARLAAARACEDKSRYFMRDALYKGGVGVALLGEELDAGHAAMPLLERYESTPPVQGSPTVRVGR